MQYRRNHRSASGNCRLKNDVLHSEKTENGSTSVTQIQGLSSVQERRYTHKRDESLKRWKPVPELQTESHLKEPEDTFLHSNCHLKEKRAEDHPLYAAEWKSFWERRQQHFKLNEKDSLEEDFMPDWIKHFFFFFFYKLSVTSCRSVARMYCTVSWQYRYNTYIP